MEPRIQYARTADGVSIAFWTLGEGMPLVWVPGGVVSNMWGDWQIPWAREWDELLATRWKLVKFDRRGNGHSQRDTADFSLDALVLDLEAVVDHLALEKFALDAGLAGGPVAITYAARHPEKASHLFLWNSYARGADFWRSPRLKALRALAEADWDTYIEATAHLYYADPVAGAALLREGATPEAQRAFADAASRHDVTELLSQVRCPTLLMRAGSPLVVSEKLVTDLASRIPGASLVVGDFADRLAMLQIIDEFLGEGEPAAAPLPSGTAVILFADIAESTALTEELGDAAFRAKARELDTSLRGIIRECAGTPVEGKLLGDGVLAVFTSARQAIDAALRCGTAGDEAGLPLHLGVHAGDVIREENNVYGGAVNIAARIAAASEPGEVLVSDTVRSLARTSAGVAFEDRGEHELKGVAEPQRLFAVHWREDA